MVKEIKSNKTVKHTLFLIVSVLIHFQFFGCKRNYYFTIVNESVYKISGYISTPISSENFVLKPFECSSKFKIHHRKSPFFAEAEIDIFITDYEDSLGNVVKKQSNGGIGDSKLRKKNYVATITADSGNPDRIFRIKVK